ncbi:MAG: tetratricopeptide repeat protein [Nitrospinota bacterium]
MADIKTRRSKILVVDDSQNARKTVRNMLRTIGYVNIDEADDGDTAFEKLKAKQFDFVIADLYMPRVSGLELLQFIREEPSLRDLPFLIITADTDTGHITRAAEEDVDGYIIKPFVTETLGKKIISIIEKKANPSKVEVRLKLGNVYMDNHLYDKALVEYEKARQVKPGSARITHAIGRVYKAMGEIDKAEGFFVEAVTYNPRYIKVQQSLAELHLERGNEAEAIRYLKQAATISPNDSARQISLGKLYLKNGLFEEAEKAFQYAVKSDPKNAELQTQIGEIYLENGQAERAAEAFRGSLGLIETVHVYNRLGIALRRKERYKEAIEEYKKALRVEPDNEVVYYNLGRALLEENQKYDAIGAFRKALELNPDFNEAKEMLDKLASPMSA